MSEGINGVKPGTASVGHTTAFQLPTSPAQVAAPSSGLALQGRRAITISNEDATITIRVGDSTISAGSGGMPIYAHGTASLDALAHCALFVIADSGSVTVSWMEAN